MLLAQPKIAINDFYVRSKLDANYRDAKLEIRPKVWVKKESDNLDGWEIPDNNIWWKAEKGILVCKSGPEQKGSILWTSKEYKDFIFRAIELSPATPINHKEKKHARH